LRALPDHFRIAGLAGSSPVAAAAAAERYAVPFHTDEPAALAARPDVDLVVIAVKVPEHRRLIEQVLDAGKAIYCEWPLGNGLDEAEVLAARLEDGRIDGFIGLQARSAPPLRFVADLIAQGYVGEVLASEVSALVGEPWNGRSSPRRAYLNEKANGATMLSIPFGHCLDLVTSILGPAERLQAQAMVKRPTVLLDGDAMIASDVEDHVAVLATLGDGVFGSFCYRGEEIDGDGFRWDITGTGGRLRVLGQDGHVQYGQVRIFGGRTGEALKPLPLPDTYRLAPVEPASHAFAVAHAYLAVADALEGKPNLAPRFADALALHRMLDRIERAAHSAGR